MIELTIIGSLTSIKGSGKLELGLIHRGLRLYEVKELIVKEIPELLPSTISLWWKGYILHNDSLTLSKACVGVNGEFLDNNCENLLIFMTIKTADRISDRHGHRSNSFDVEKLRMELRKQTTKIPCTIL